MSIQAILQGQKPDLSNKPGKILTGQIIEPEPGQKTTALDFAEIFNNYSERIYDPSGGIAQSGNIAVGIFSHAEGDNTTAIGGASHAEGQETIVYGLSAHAEGKATIAQGDHSHAEGADGTFAKGAVSHAEGLTSRAYGDFSHAEGRDTLAEGESSHAEGTGSRAVGSTSHAEGREVIAQGDFSHSEGDGTIARGAVQHVQGRFNVVDDNDRYAHIVGNGKDPDHRSNAYALDWEGNAEFAGRVSVAPPFNPSDAANKEYVEKAITVITPTYIGALPLSGGTLTGDLYQRNDVNGFLRVTSGNHGTSGYFSGLDADARDKTNNMRRFFINSENNDITLVHWQGGTAVNDYKIYHTGNKPTPKELNALDIGINRPELIEATDLNTLTTVGGYKCSYNSLAATLLNSPTQTAFIMDVISADGNTLQFQDGKWGYLIQEIKDLNGNRYFRNITNNGTNFVFDPWIQEYNTLRKPSAAEINALPIYDKTGQSVNPDTINESCITMATFTNHPSNLLDSQGTIITIIYSGGWRQQFFISPHSDGANDIVYIRRSTSPDVNYGAWGTNYLPITSSTTDLTAGSSALPSGNIYLVYE